MKTSLTKWFSGCALPRFFTLLAALGLASAVEAATDINGDTPYTWYTFDTLTEGSISAATSVPNNGSCTTAMSISSGSIVANDGDGKTWTIASSSVQTETAKTASVNPSTYIVRINFNGQTYDNKVIWSCNGKGYGGICLVVNGNSSGYTLYVCKHFGSKSTLAYTYTVPADKMMGYHWYALTTAQQSMTGSKFYVDGLLIGTTSASENWYSGQNCYFCFGKYGNGNDAVPTGLLYDDMRMYDQVLTSEKIKNIAGTVKFCGAKWGNMGYAPSTPGVLTGSGTFGNGSYGSFNVNFGTVDNISPKEIEGHGTVKLSKITFVRRESGTAQPSKVKVTQGDKTAVGTVTFNQVDRVLYGDQYPGTATHKWTQGSAKFGEYVATFTSDVEFDTTKSINLAFLDASDAAFNAGLRMIQPANSVCVSGGYSPAIEIIGDYTPTVIDYKATVSAATATWSSKTGLTRTSDTDWQNSKYNSVTLTNEGQDDAVITIDEDIVADTFKVVSTSGKKLTIKGFDRISARAIDFSEAAGKVAFDIDGTELAKNTVVGAPYSYWFYSGAITGTSNIELPTMPKGYSCSIDYVSGYGTRFVVKTAIAMFGSVNINFMGNKSSQTSDNNAKVSTVTTDIGAHPIVGTSWVDLEGKNQTSTAISQYVTSDGSLATGASITLTASQVNNAYGSGAANNMLITGYIDDSKSPIVQIANIPFAKYRVILYRATDTASTTFSAAQIGTTSSSTKIYYGPTSSDTTGGNTLVGSTETVWGKSDYRTSYIEGVNYIVSDVLEGTPGSATAYIYSHKHSGRAGVAAIQIVEVGAIAEVGDTLNVSIWDTSTSDKVLIDGTKLAGYVPVLGSAWNQLQGTGHTASTDKFCRTNENLTVCNADGTTATSAAKVELSAGNCYRTGGAHTTGNGQLTYNFFDDSQYLSTGRAGGFKFEDVPFNRYAALVYMAADNSDTTAKMGPVNVTIGDGTTVQYPVSGTGWGGRGYTWEINGVLEFDTSKNMVAVPNVKNTTINITGSVNGTPSNTRGGLAGVQLVEIVQTYSAMITGTKNFSDISNWIPSKPAGGFSANDKFVITASGTATLTLDGTLSVKSVVLTGTSSDTLTIAKGDGFTVTDGITVEGGLKVKANNGSGGYAFNGDTVTIENGTVVLNNGNSDAKVTNTVFNISADGNLDNYGWLYFYDTVTFNADSDKEILKNTGATSPAAIQGTGTIVKGGTGKITLAARPVGQPITVNTGTLTIIHYNADSSVGAVTGSGTLEIAANAVVTASSIATTTTVIGSGTLVFVGDGGATLPTAPSGVTLASGWTGTVWLKNYGVSTQLANMNFNNYGNANSTVCLSQIRGYFAGATTVNPTLKIENASYDYGLHICNGSSNDGNVSTFKKLTGSGLLKGDGDSTAGFVAENWDGFTGSVNFSTKTLTFGTTKKANVNQIIVNSGSVVSLVSGQTFTAGGGIQVDGTIGGAGTLASNTTFGDGATICTTNGTLTASGTLTFNENSTKVRVASALTAGTAVKVLAKSGTTAGKIETTVSIYVGDNTTAEEGSYKLFYGTDGVYVAKYAAYNLTLDADKTWAELFNGVTLNAYDEVTITATDGKVLTFGSITNVNCAVTITGGAVLKLADGLWDNGCWEKTIAVFGSFTANDVTFATLKDGFHGEYTKTDTGFKLRAQNREVISINIAGGNISAGGTHAKEDSPSDNLVPEDDVLYGVAPTPGRTWNNINGKWREVTTTVTLKGSKAYDGNEQIDRATIDLSATAYTTWQAGISNPFLRGYLDDGKALQVAVHGIPYSKYDVIVYATSDSASWKLSPVTVNGKQYTFVNGATVEGSSDWGTPLCNVPAIGDNALYITNCIGEQLTISATKSSGGRGTLCAVQVICQGNIEVSSTYVADVTAANVTWTGAADDEGITSYGQQWTSGQLSTLTLTNTVTSRVTFETAPTGQLFKVVSAVGNKMTIPAESFEKMSFSMIDFSEAYGKVEIDCSDVTAGSEKTILAGELAGNTNVTYTSTGAWGAYADENGIHMAPKADVQRTNPVIATETKNFGRSFFGTTDASWDTLANWRMESNGIWVPATKLPGISGGDYPALFIDGNVSSEDTVAVNTLEGYTIQYAFLNGATVTANTLKKIQTGGSGVTQFIWVDSASSFTVNAFGNDSYDGALNLYIAATDGITFPACAKSVVLNYYLTNNATARFTGAVTAGTHTIKAMSLEVGETKSAHHVEKKTLVTLSAAGVTFTKDANIAVSLDNKNVTPTYIETIPVCTNDVGTYTIKTEADGVYAYVVQYADAWDVVDPLTATLTTGTTTNWADLTWTDFYGHTFTSPTGSHEYIVNASNVTATLNFEANVEAKSITLKNDTADVLTLTKGNDVTAPTLTFTQVAGKAVVAWQVSALASSTDKVAYTGGAGTEESRVQIAHNGGTLNLEGGAYKLAASFNGTETTVNMTDITADYVIPSGNYYAFAVGKANYTLAGNTKITTPSFWLAQGAVGYNSVFTMDGNAQLIVTGEISEDTNHSSVMFGHWDASSVFTLKGNAYFAVTNAQVLVGKTGNTQTINLDGGTFVAKGIKTASNASGVNTLNLGGATLVLGAVGIDSYSTSRTIAVNVTNDSTIAFMTNAPITQAISISAGKTLTLEVADNCTNTISGTVANSGTIEVTNGTALFMPGTFNGTITENGGTVLYGYDIDINDAGEFKVPAGKAASKIVLFNKAGEVVKPIKVTDTTISYESKMTDFSAWWDYEFNGNLNNTGTSGHGAMTKWGADPTYTEGNDALYIHARPAIGVSVSDWPSEATFVMYGKMVRDDNKYQVAFGSKNGDSNNLIFLATGDVSQNEVHLCASTAAGTPVVLASMTVPNAQTTDHLYAFVIKTVDGNTVVDVYLDGALLQPYQMSGTFSLGGGFQIGSPHGGDVANYSQVADDDPGTLDWLRVYEKELNSDAMAKYAQEYPYNSPNGTYTRTLDGTECTWVQDGQWKSNDTEVVDRPAPNAVVKVDAEAATGLAVNLPESVTYETVTIDGADKVTITNQVGSTGHVQVTGRITINTDTVLASDAFETFGSAISIGNGNVLTLDLGNADIGKYWTTTDIDLTGAIICSDYETQVKLQQPKTVKAPRTVSMSIDDASKHAWVHITVPTDPIVGTVTANATNWVWAGSAIDESDIDFDQDEVVIKLVLDTNVDWTYDPKFANVESITVAGGNLNIGTNRNMTVMGTGTVDAQLSEEEKTAAEAGDIELFAVAGGASVTFRNVTDKDGNKLDIIGSNGKVRIRPETDLKGLMLYMACPKPNYHDRDPNGRQSGWIDLVNYGPTETNLANFKIIRTNLGKAVKTSDDDMGYLLDKTLAVGETFRVYTSEEYPTAEDYGGDGNKVAWFATVDGEVTQLDTYQAGAIMVVPTKVNPKKYPMVRLYEFTTGEAVVKDQVIVPCDIDDDAQIVFGTDKNKIERWVVQDDVKTEYGPDVNSLYGVKNAETDLALLNSRGFVKAGEDFEIELPVNPFKIGDNDALANNEIQSVTLEYRVFDDSKEEDEMSTNDVEMVKKEGKLDSKLGQLWTATIPAEKMTAGALIQYRARITDAGGKTFYAPRFLNQDVGYKWYGAVVQPTIVESPEKDSTSVCTTGLQTFLMFACGTNKTQMDVDADSQTLPNKARVAIFDTQTGTYYDNVRIDLRGQTSSHFLKKSHGFRFSKVAPLKCTNPFDGEEIEVRKTSFIAEYADPIFMRQALALQVMRTAGVKAPFDYPVRLYRNGKFYQLAFHSNRFTDEIVEDYYKLNAKTGHAYKNVGELLSSGWEGTGTEKKTPDDDNEKGEGAFDVITAYADRINTSDTTTLTQEAMKYFNLPAWINYMAATKITQEADDVWTNLGIYINKYDGFYNEDGDDTMMPLAYDQNLSFGQWYRGDDGARYTHEKGIVVTNDMMKSHPFYGGSVVKYHKWDNTTINRYNRGMEVILQNATYREALVRRIRTLADEFLGAPGTPKKNSAIWQWAQAYSDAMEEDVIVDHDKWGYDKIGMDQSHCDAIWIWPSGKDAPTFNQGMDELWNTYIAQRRIHLYCTHSTTNSAKAVGYAQDKSAGIPFAQSDWTELVDKVGVLDLDGNTPDDAAFNIKDGVVILTNKTDEAIDMSGWTIAGLAKCTFKDGTVLPKKGVIYLVNDRRSDEAMALANDTTNPMIVNVDKAEGEKVKKWSGVSEIILTDANGNDMITHEAKIVDADDNETFYLTLTNAVAAAKSNEEIKMLKDVTTTAALIITNSIDFDCNEFKLTASTFTLEAGSKFKADDGTCLKVTGTFTLGEGVDFRVKASTVSGSQIATVPEGFVPGATAVKVYGEEGYTLTNDSGALKLVKTGSTVEFDNMTYTAQTNFNGSVVVATYKNLDAGDGYTLTAELKVKIGDDYETFTGTIDTTTRTATFVLPGSKVVAGTVYSGTITVMATPKTEGEATTVDTENGYIYQGTEEVDEKTWIDESPSKFETTGAWDPDPETNTTQFIFTQNVTNTFTATTEQAGNKVVFDTNIVFDAPDDFEEDIGTSQAGFKLVTDATDETKFLLATLVDGEWVTSAVYAQTNVEYTIRTTIDYHLTPTHKVTTVAYELVDGKTVTAIYGGNTGSESTKVANIKFAGEGKVSSFVGTDYVDYADAKLVADTDGKKYATIDAAIEAGKTELTLMTNVEWTPDATKDGEWTIHGNGYKLFTTPAAGLRVVEADGTYTVYANYYEVMQFSGATSNKVMYLSEAFKTANVTNVLLRDVALTNTLTIANSATFNGDLYEVTGDIAIGDGVTLKVTGGYIGLTKSGTGTLTLEGGKYTEEGTNAFASCVAEGYHFSTLAKIDALYADYVMQIVKGEESKEGEMVFPVSKVEQTSETEATTNYVGEVAFTKEWLIENEVAVTNDFETKKGMERITTKLNTVQENKIETWENLVLGLDGTEEENIPVIQPVQTTDKEKITFQLGGVNVDTNAGVKVEYKVWSGLTPGAKTQSSPTATPDMKTAMPLPDSGVKYYTIEVITTPAK